MSLQHTRLEAGPALAHGMRVTLRFACLMVLLIGSIASAQPVPGQQAVTDGAAGEVSSTARDTLIMKQVEPERGWWGTVTNVTSGLISIVALLLLAVLIPVVWGLRNVGKSVQRTVEKLQGDIAPLVQHANSISDDVNYISTSVRADVQRINQTVAMANRQLLATVKKAEDRVNEFNALLAVAQEEAEDAFISTAAALRGISTGAAALTGVDRGRRRRGPRRARQDRDRDLRESMAELRAAIDEDLHSAVEDVGPALEDSFVEEESANGNDDGRGAADSGREAPRSGGQRPGDGPGPGAGGAV